MITIVFPYFNNGKMLLRHIQEWKQFKYPERWNVVIADDCSKQDPLSNYLGDLAHVPFHSVKAFEISTDIAWNQDGARNLCFHHVDNSWCVSTDADHLLDSISANHILEFVATTIPLEPNHYYRFWRSNANTPEQLIEKYHPNSYLIHSDLYWGIGGYEEKLAGFYGKDGNFRRRLELYGVDSGFLPEPIHLTRFSLDDIPDANTTEYGRKDSKYHVQNHEHAKRISLSTDKPTSWLNFNWRKLCG